MCSDYVPACQYEYPRVHLASHVMVINFLVVNVTVMGKL